jgi:acetyl-CoA C-acetyltransferase
MDFDEMWISPSHKDSPEAPNRDMSITVGWNAARLTGITRDELDAWALRSHQRAVAGIDNGAFVDEIAPIEVSKGGETFTFAVDEHPRRETSMEKLAGLKPLHPEIEGFNITPGNSSGVNDAAGAVMVVSSELAERLGLEPLAIVRSWASAGVDPVETGLAPIQAIPKAAKRAGISLDDVDLFEINEAFASVPIAAVKAFGLDEEKVNPLGSGCSLGHPVAMTGVRMVMTIMNELRRRGGGIGLTSMCAGGGMGSAVVIEVLKP